MFIPAGWWVVDCNQVLTAVEEGHLSADCKAGDAAKSVCKRKEGGKSKTEGRQK